MALQFTHRSGQRPEPISPDKNRISSNAEFFLQHRFQYRETLRRRVASLWEAPRLRQLPLGLSKKYQSAFLRVFHLIHNPPLYLRYLDEFEGDVFVAMQNGLAINAAVETVLEERERSHGFGPVYQIPRRLHSGCEWMGILRQGRPIFDGLFWLCQHGSQSHRIQWQIVMRDFERNRTLYGGVNGIIEFFCSLGDEAAVTRWDWRGTGWQEEAAKEPYFSLWDPLFDSYESNFTSPEFLNMLLTHCLLLGAN